VWRTLQGAVKKPRTSNTTNNYVTQTVDAAGATIEDTSSGLVVQIPQGALSQSTQISIGTQANAAYPALP
jgi:hypothetical protein